MKTHTVLYSRKNNENSNTPSYPIGEWANGKCVRNGQVTEIDLEEMSTHCLYHDDNQLVECKTYSLCDVYLPDWLSVDEWISNSSQWKWAWTFGAKPNEWPEAWQRALAYDIQGSIGRLSCSKLLNTKNFKSEFRQSLRDQLIKWIETPRDKREHASPFSPKQWESLADRYTVLEAKRLDQSCYYNRHYAGAGPFMER